MGSTLELLDAWQKLTPPKLLFIAQAMANSSEALTPLRMPFEWLKDSSVSLLSGMHDMAKIGQKLAEEEIHANKMASFLRDVDVPISKITVETLELPRLDLNALSKIFEKENNPIDAILIPKKRTVLTHKTALGDAELIYEDESEGTKNLIGFWLPWDTRNLSDNCFRLLIVDELDSSLHPKIVAALIEKHINSSIPSQLIFTGSSSFRVELAVENTLL